MTIKTFEIKGRMNPSEKDPEPQIFRMKLFARDAVCARSKFWYFIR
jgi:large subunit ribosomal protein L18Ae